MYVTKRLLFFKSKNNGYLLFCGNSNSFYQIDDANVPKIQEMIKKGDISTLPEEMVKEFKKSGILLPENDEAFYKRMKFISYNSRFLRNHLTLTIAPTMACNFKCIYCYEENRTTDIGTPNTLMTNEVLTGIIEFIIRSQVKSVSVCWYGGEPLCAWNKIVEFNKKIKKIGLVSYKQSIVTNGSLIDNEKIQYFDDEKFENIQVTLDGSESFHNKSRPMKNGGNSYKEVIHGLDLIYEYSKLTKHNIPVNIRVNISKDNASEYNVLYKNLKEKYDNLFNVYSATVTKRTEKDFHSSSCMNCLDEIEFILDMAKEHRIKMRKLFPDNNHLLNCGAQCINNYVISPNGDLYRCWDDIGIKSLSIGNILKGPYDPQNVNFKYILESSAFEQNNCTDCLFLYSCLGGCPRLRFNKDNGLNISLCSLIKNNPQEFLETYFELKKLDV